MPQFTYRVLKKAGGNLEGVLSAATREEAIRDLRRQGHVPLHVEQGEAAGPRPARRFRFGRPKGRDLLIFTSQLAAVLKAGLTLSRSLEIIADQCSNSELRRIITDVREEVIGGESLSEAFRRYPRVFGRLYCNMVSVGENSGKLEDVLGELARYLEMSQTMRANVVSAMAYPAIIVVVGILSITVLMLVVVPKLEVSFAELNIQLPLLTRAVIGASRTLVRFGWLIPLFLAGGYLTWRRIRGLEKVQIRLDRIHRKTPLLGPTTEKVNMARFSRTMATLVASGIPVVQSIELVARTIGSTVLQRALRSVTDRVRKGEGIAGPLADTGAVPGIVCSLIGVGEESGQLETMFNQIAQQYEMEVDIALKRFLSLFEPVVIICMAGVVGTVVFAFLLPMLSMTQEWE